MRRSNSTHLMHWPGKAKRWPNIQPHACAVVVFSPGELSDRFQSYLVADADAGRPKLCHYQPELDSFSVDLIHGSYCAPPAGEPAHRSVWSTWLEGVWLVIQSAQLAEKEAMLSGHSLECDAVIEHTPKRHVGAASCI